jgi:hypothetical protein
MNNETKSKWTKVGELKKATKGSLYIDIQVPLTTKDKCRLQLQDPRAFLKSLLQSNKITEDVYNERLGKIPDFIKYNVFLVE